MSRDSQTKALKVPESLISLCIIYGILKYNQKAKKAIGALMVTIRNSHNVKNTAVSLVLILVQSAHLHLPPLTFDYYCHIIKKLRNWDQRNVKKSIHQSIKCNCTMKKNPQSWRFHIFLFQHFLVLIVRKLFLMPELNFPYCNRNCVSFYPTLRECVEVFIPFPFIYIFGAYHHILSMLSLY